jgi:response regulator receiver protein
LIFVKHAEGHREGEDDGMAEEKLAEQRQAEQKPATPARILVVEDESLIRMLLEDMLTDLGHKVVATAASVEAARKLAAAGGFDVAILDVNLEGQEIFPVAEILSERGVPFVFASGYGHSALPEQFRDRLTLQKPFQGAQLEAALKALLQAV